MDPHICWPSNIAPAGASHPAELLTSLWESVWVFLELYFSYIYEFELTRLVLAASWHSRKDRARPTHTSPSPLASLFVALYSARNKLLFLETPTGKCWALYGGHSRLKQSHFSSKSSPRRFRRLETLLGAVVRAEKQRGKKNKVCLTSSCLESSPSGSACSFPSHFFL